MKAVFPGKFSPPHMGHAATILALSKAYDLTVVVTGDRPPGAVMSSAEIAAEISLLGVSVELFAGVLTEQKTDPWNNTRLILSGNPDVIAWARKIKAPAKFVARSGTMSARHLRGK